MKQETTTLGDDKRKLFLIILCYAALYIVWGSTYFFIKRAIHTIAPLYVVGIRFFLGGTIFMVLAAVTGRLKRLPSKKELLSSIIIGVLLLIGGNGLITLAERRVDSYLAALIVSTTPVAVGLFDWVLFGKKLTKSTITGICLGVTGVAVLLYDGSTHGVVVTPEILMVVGGMLSWSLATSLGHRLTVYPDPLINSGLQMLFVGILCLGIMNYISPLTVDAVKAFSVSSIAGLLYLVVFGSATFLAYTFLVRHEPAIRVVSYTFVNPLVAIIIGVLIGGEVTKPLVLPGAAFILAGLGSILYGDRIVKKLLRKW